MKESTAKRIALLLNERNNLPNKLESWDINHNDYFYIAVNQGLETEKVLACARAKCMSFFCYELKHVVVNEDYEGKGLGKLVINLVETYVKQKRIPILLATTRAENCKMNNLFKKLGYSKTKEFVNQGTKHPLILWKKELL